MLWVNFVYLMLKKRQIQPSNLVEFLRLKFEIEIWIQNFKFEKTKFEQIRPSLGEEARIAFKTDRPVWRKKKRKKKF